MTASIESGVCMSRGEQVFIAILQIVAIFMFVKIIAATGGCAEVDQPIGWPDIVDAAAGSVTAIPVVPIVGEAVSATLEDASDTAQNDAQEAPEPVGPATESDEGPEYREECDKSVSIPMVPPIIIEAVEGLEDIPGC